MIGWYCTQCGVRLFDGGNFCTKCGASAVILSQKASVDDYKELYVVDDGPLDTYEILDFSVSTTSTSLDMDQLERDREEQERRRKQREQKKKAEQQRRLRERAWQEWLRRQKEPSMMQRAIQREQQQGRRR